MKKKNVKKILEVLNDLKLGTISKPNHGICINLMFKLDCTDCISEFTNQAFTQIYGNEDSYPIEGNSLGYIQNKDKWNPDTEYGKKRLELLDKLIEFAEGKLCKTNYLYSL